MASEMKTSESPIFLVGATGTGKSAVAVELARTFAGSGGAAILAMDAMQVYRGADIGTSKPSLAERAEIPHGGLDLVNFGESFDVAQYLKHAATFLDEQRAAGRRVIIVGGTGLYFRALTRGLCEAPHGPQELRAELSALSTDQLRERLRKVDPGMLERIDVANPRRLVRAIEVMEATGRSLKDWQEETPEPLIRDFTAFWICREKEELSVRIKERVETMFAQGWVEEVRGLVGAHGMEAVRRFGGIGYREIAEMIGKTDQISRLAKLPNGGEDDGELGKVSHGGLKRGEEGGGKGITELGMGGDGNFLADRLKANETGVASCALRAPGQRVVRATENKVKSDIWVATRQYAKRQLTWFAREPKLQKVMLTGSQPIFAVLPSLL